MTNKGMTRFETIRTLRKHVRLSERRSEVWKQNKVAKALIYFSGVVTVLYLIFIAVMISLIANSSETRTPYEIIFGLLPFLMAVDFGVRLMAQQTPSQLIKPYILLPLPKLTCIDSFMVSSLTNGGNLIWMGLFLPYTIMSVVFAMGFWKAVVFLLALYLIILIWSQWYMLGRSLVNRSYLWWIVPAVVFALLFSPWYIGKNASITTLCDTYANIGLWLERYPLLVLAALVAILALLIAVNRRLQLRFVYAELAKVNQTHLKHVTEIKSLDRFGEVGEYIKLEIKSIMRNKNCRKSFITGLVFVVMFSALISFTDIYDAAYMKMFLVLYNFSIFGTMLLSRVMCFEGQSAAVALPAHDTHCGDGQGHGAHAALLPAAHGRPHLLSALHSCNLQQADDAAEHEIHRQGEHGDELCAAAHLDGGIHCAAGAGIASANHAAGEHDFCGAISAGSGLHCHAQAMAAVGIRPVYEASLREHGRSARHAVNAVGRLTEIIVIYVIIHFSERNYRNAQKFFINEFLIIWSHPHNHFE